MNTSPHWQPLPTPPIIDVLHEDEEIEDVVALSAASAPSWLRRLRIPSGWQRIQLPLDSGQSPARLAVAGPINDGEWAAADTISVSGFTGWPQFYDVFRRADRVLRELGAAGVSVQVLPVPSLQWTAAVRSRGTALIGDRQVWIQQANYVAGSDRRHASRLVVHTTLVNAECREQLAESISLLTKEVYDGFINALTGGLSTH